MLDVITVTYKTSKAIKKWQKDYRNNGGKAKGSSSKVCRSFKGTRLRDCPILRFRSPCRSMFWKPTQQHLWLNQLKMVAVDTEKTMGPLSETMHPQCKAKLNRSYHLLLFTLRASHHLELFCFSTGWYFLSCQKIPMVCGCGFSLFHVIFPACTSQPKNL